MITQNITVLTFFMYKVCKGGNVAIRVNAFLTFDLDFHTMLKYHSTNGFQNICKANNYLEINLLYYNVLWQLE